MGYSGIAGEALGGNGGGLPESFNGGRSCLPDGRAGVASLQGRLQRDRRLGLQLRSELGSSFNSLYRRSRNTCGFGLKLALSVRGKGRPAFDIFRDEIEAVHRTVAEYSTHEDCLGRESGQRKGRRWMTR